MEKKELLEKLKALKVVTNEVLAELVKGDRTAFGAVNWANLRCAEASFVVDSDGTEYYSVLIEEASPECFDFRIAVQSALLAKGCDVYVTTEW